VHGLCRETLAAPDRAAVEAGLAPLGRALLEASSAYYALGAARIRQRGMDAAAALGSCPPEVAAATAFKVGGGCGGPHSGPGRSGGGLAQRPASCGTSTQHATSSDAGWGRDGRRRAQTEQILA
jgi:hypothetical protein